MAPDSFKGSLNASEIAQSMASGVKKAAPDSIIDMLPIADGGEGTMDCMIEAVGGHIVTVSIHDPLGNARDARYGLLVDGTVVIEAAEANGLELIERDERNPLLMNTVGVGELIVHALDAGHTSFIIGIGGSGTNDAGIGMLYALGVRLLDVNGNELEPLPLSLSQLFTLDCSQLHPNLRLTTMHIATDVSNPLCGEQGATAIFGPQKGVRSEWIDSLDQGFRQLSVVIDRQFGISTADMPGAGAAGGMGAAFVGVLGAKLGRGIDIILEMTDFNRRAKAADLIFTGEGKTDTQTLQGKAVYGVVVRAKTLGTPVICVSGSYGSDVEDLYDMGLDAMLSIVPGPVSLEQSLLHAKAYIVQTCFQAMRIFLAGQRQ
ncbi:MAG: glycerate kinase [Acidibacillus sp.]|nr:glycerate kinase [Acidibacillus sp.]